MKLPILLALLSAAAVAQQPSAVYPIGGDVKAPTIQSRQEPVYSRSARMGKLQGSVILHLIVDETGRTRDIRVVRSLGLGLDENAIAAAVTWKFNPATKGDQAVAVESLAEVKFHLQLDPQEWSLARVAFTAPAESILPMLLLARYPPLAGGPDFATVRVSFDIDAQGKPLNLHVDESSDPKWNDEVMKFLLDWRFQAAIKDDERVPSHATFDLTRGVPPPPAPTVPDPKK